jgi:5-methyltetrahydrofolate--homocysteine methyltransferase
MTKKEFLELAQSKVVILDGATGSNLQKEGMPVGVCPEQWILDNKDVMIQLQKDYIKAGSDILYAPTFTANRIKLEEYGLYENISNINRELVKLSKEAINQAKAEGLNRTVYVAGDLTMTGEQVYPVGKLQFEELVDIYKEQVMYLLMEGVDLIVIETMMSLQECRAAVIAVSETCDLPIMVTLTFNEDMRTLFGTDPATAMVVMQSLGVDAVGVNCSTGPEKMCEVVKVMKQYANVPIIAKPNAGLPRLVDGVTTFDMEAEEFSVEVKKLVESGAGIVGGCCGTTPEHIRMLSDLVKDMVPPTICTEKKRVLTTERKTLEIHLDGKFLVIGERINPTGKKALQAELLEGKMNIVDTMAEEQVENGADILDINMGMNGIDEKEMMLKVIYEVNRLVNVPLCIDSSHIHVIEEALRIYPGRALINSISLEKEKFEKLIPIAKKYGAMFILLPLSDKGLPKDIAEKKEIIHTILDAAVAQGLSKEDIIVDGLVNTIGANKMAALETMETIRYCKEELGLLTTCGLSNISFGLPERQFVNTTFLAFAIREGLTMAIANPSQDLLMNIAFASDLLLNKEEADIRYINRVTSKPMTITSGVSVANTQEVNGENKQTNESNSVIYDEVIKGNKKNIIESVIKSIDDGNEPSHIIDTMLIPAINQVGALFDKQIYFLPQLIASAETMKTAIDYLEPMLQLGGEQKKLATVVMATVAGDIHDIGKNLVVLMLKNYGFRVIDLGKDVSTDLIIRTAKEENADIIGLSALMTTTMMEMKQVVIKAKEAELKAQIIIGGAVITQSFADEIGADGYSKDAQDAVKLVKRLLHIA